MLATVTIRAEAFDDPRISFLGRLLGCSTSEAFARVMRLWAACAAKQSDRLEVRLIRACLENLNGEVLLAECGLGDDTRHDPQLPDGGIRVRGCDKTDWYFARIEQQGQVDAGRARAAAAQRDAAGRFLPGDLPPDGDLSSQSPASDLCLDLISDPSLRKAPDLGAIVGEERERAFAELTPKAVPPQRSRAELRRKLFGDAWSYAGLKHEELKNAGVDPTARNCWSGTPAGDPVNLLFNRIDELAIGEDAVRAFGEAGLVIHNRVDVAAAIARRDNTLRWFTPARMWDAKSFAIDKDLSPEQAGQPRGPKPRPDNDPPPRKIATAR